MRLKTLGFRRLFLPPLVTCFWKLRSLRKGWPKLLDLWNNGHKRPSGRAAKASCFKCFYSAFTYDATIRHVLSWAVVPLACHAIVSISEGCCSIFSCIVGGSRIFFRGGQGRVGPSVSLPRSGQGPSPRRKTRANITHKSINWHSLEIYCLDPQVGPPRYIDQLHWSRHTLRLCYGQFIQNKVIYMQYWRLQLQ